MKVDLTNEYNSIMFLLEFLIKQKSPYRNAVWAYTIEEFENELISRSNYEFPNESDPDIIKLKQQAKEMLKNIQDLRVQLI